MSTARRVTDIARDLRLPVIAKGPVRKDHLSLQEATALLQTMHAEAMAYPVGCARWADGLRTLTFLALALATGRRRAGLRELKVSQVDLERVEIRVEREKGRTGRVLPVAPWVVPWLRTYLTQARPVLAWQADNPWWFVGDQGPQLGRNTMGEILERAQRATVAANPDLTELATKRPQAAKPWSAQSSPSILSSGQSTSCAVIGSCSTWIWPTSTRSRFERSTRR